MGFTVFDHITYKPFVALGFVDKFWEINVDTLIYTWASMFLMFLFSGAVVYVIKRYPRSKFTFIISMGTRYFADSITSSVGSFDLGCFQFVVGIFLFTLFANIAVILPLLEEATNDVNTALAIGLTTFLFVQYQGIRHKGWGYFAKYFKPVFIFFPVNVIGQLSKVASLSFRLLGNILAGSIIWFLIVNLINSARLLYFGFIFLSLILLFLYNRWPKKENYKVLGKVMALICILVNFAPGIQLFFNLFEGFIQAFVISLLTSMYISSEISSEGH